MPWVAAGGTSNMIAATSYQSDEPTTPPATGSNNCRRRHPVIFRLTVTTRRYPDSSPIYCRWLLNIQRGRVKHGIRRFRCRISGRLPLAASGVFLATSNRSYSPDFPPAAEPGDATSRSRISYCRRRHSLYFRLTKRMQSAFSDYCR